MKTFYALSDTHGNKSFEQFLQVTKNAELYVHLGDYTRDCDALKALTPQKVVGVRGNNDFDQDYPLFEVITVGGVRFLLTHGHTYNVKYSFDRLIYKALECDAKCVLYGHTHVPDISYREGIFIACPGAFGRSSSTYLRIEVENGNFRPDLLIIK